MPEEKEVQRIYVAYTEQHAFEIIKEDAFKTSLVIYMKLGANEITVLKRNGYHPPKVFQDIEDNDGKKISDYGDFSVYLLYITPTRAFELLQEIMLRGEIVVTNMVP